MKKLILTVCVVALLGCAPKVVIPDRPVLREVHGIAIEGGVCFDDDNARILVDNIKRVMEHEKKLLELLKEK
jgi:hypothetical protein